MDFFETQERYRRREMRGWMTLLIRAVVVGGCLWEIILRPSRVELPAGGIFCGRVEF